MPKKAVAPSLTKIVTLRFSPAEHDYIRTLATQHDMSLSALVRCLVCGIRLPPQRLPRVDSEMVHQLAKLGANLNQITHAINRWTQLAPEEKREVWIRHRKLIVELARQVGAIKSELIR